MPKRILVAENNGGLPGEIQVALKNQGFEIVYVSNGKQALQEARTNRPDLLITEVSMPEMNGYTLIREFKKDDSLKSVPVVLSTASGNMDPIFMANMDIQGYLPKPLQPTKLVEVAKKLTQAE